MVWGEVRQPGGAGSGVLLWGAQTTKGGSLLGKHN